MDQISKIKVSDVLSVCLIRHESTTTCKCSDCKYFGSECIEAHRYADMAVRVLKTKEVQDAEKENK